MQHIQTNRTYILDKPTARTAKEDFISQIVARTNTKDKKTLAKRIALTANTLHWSETDLHNLLKKADDPSIRNYSAFVNWSLKVKNKV